MLEALWPYMLVFSLGATPFFEATVIIPLAILAGLASLPVFVLAIAGNLLTLYPVIVFVERVRTWYQRKALMKKSRRASPLEPGAAAQEPDDAMQAEDTASKREKRARGLWDKYGLPGLALLGPTIVGSHLTAFLALGFGGSKKRVTLWVTGSIVVWSLLLGLLAHFGVDLLTSEEIELLSGFWPDRAGVDTL